MWGRAAAAIALLGLLGLAGCSKVPDAKGSHARSAASRDVVRVAINSEPNSLNPVLESTLAEVYVEEAIFNGLVKLNGNGSLIPDLATVVPSLENGGISRDGKTVTYHLRHGVTWHDGAPFSSADVAFTFAAIMDPKTNGVYQSYYRRVKKLETPNPYTVIVHLDAPFAEILNDFFSCNTLVGILPKHLYEHSRDINRDYYNAHPIGTGPYRFVRWDHGSLIVLEANSRYFGGAPKIRELDIHIVPNQNTLIAMIGAHDLDVAPQVAPTELGRLRGIAGVRTVLAQTYVERFVSFNVTHPPFDDARVRRALALALDRKRIAGASFAGSAIQADSLLPPYSWAYEPNNGSPPFDRAAAMRLLDEAGWTAGPDGIRRKNGKRLSFTLINQIEWQTLAKMAVEIQADWRDVGADAQIRPVPRNVLFGNPGLETDGKFDVAIDNSATDSDPDRSGYIESSSIAPKGFNFMRYADADIDRWSEAALASYKHADRAPLYSRIQRRLNRDLPYVPIAWERWIYAVNADLQHFEPETVGSDFWNVQEWSYAR